MTRIVANAALGVVLAFPILAQRASSSRAYAPQRTALVTYLSVGKARIALASDTIVQFGRKIGFEQSTLDDMRRTLAPATQSDSGDAASSLHWICYRLAGDSVSLVLESGEIGGGDYIDGFELVRAGSRPDLERACSRLNIPPQRVQTDRGIRIGLTKADVIRRLGGTGRDSAGVVVFERSRDKVTHARDGTRQSYTESSGFIIRFRRGRVAEFRGWRDDTT